MSSFKQIKKRLSTNIKEQKKNASQRLKKVSTRFKTASRRESTPQPNLPITQGPLLFTSEGKEIFKNKFDEFNKGDMPQLRIFSSLKRGDPFTQLTENHANQFMKIFNIKDKKTRDELIQKQIESITKRISSLLEDMRWLENPAMQKRLAEAPYHGDTAKFKEYIVTDYIFSLTAQMSQSLTISSQTDYSKMMKDPDSLLRLVQSLPKVANVTIKNQLEQPQIILSKPLDHPMPKWTPGQVSENKLHQNRDRNFLNNAKYKGSQKSENDKAIMQKAFRSDPTQTGRVNTLRRLFESGLKPNETKDKVTKTVLNIMKKKPHI